MYNSIRELVKELIRMRKKFLKLRHLYFQFEMKLFPCLLNAKPEYMANFLKFVENFPESKLNKLFGIERSALSPEAESVKIEEGLPESDEEINIEEQLLLLDAQSHIEGFSNFIDTKLAGLD